VTLCVALLLAALPALGPGRAAIAKDTAVRERGTPEPERDRTRRRRAIQRGCDFLAGAPGSLPGTAAYAGVQRTDGGFGDNKAVVALTALSVLALMSDGSTDGRGRHGKAVTLGLDFLLRLIEGRQEGSRWPEGYFWYAQDGSSRMHGQGFATLALASALGTGTFPEQAYAASLRASRIRSALEKAVRCIEGAQTRTGGFGYEPRPDADHEGSVTVAVAQGLRAARDAGVVVDRKVVTRGLFYLKNCQRSDGSFQYSLYQEQSSYALTAAALSSFFLYGKYQDDPDRTIQRGIEYLRDRLERRVDLAWYYYGHFYAAWTCWQVDGHTWSPKGDNLWGWWQQRVYPDILDKQRADGSFDPEGGRYDYGPVLSTALAVLTLAIPDETLPIFQR
jgi:hypothetical protein